MGTPLLPEFVDLFIALGDPARRLESASRIAHACGARQLLLFVRDPEVGAFVPAPGFPRTLRGGATWRELMRRCLAPGRHRARVELPQGTHVDALCLVPDGVAAVFLGGPLDETALASFERLLPIVSRTLRDEQQVQVALADARQARGSASRAQVLADALESARAEHARLNAQLREEHRRKDDFLAMLAHELRNPLTPLVTSIEIIRRAEGVVEPRHLDIMSRQLHQLSRLVEDLLDVSRVSRGRIELRRRHLSLAAMLTEAVEASRTVIEGRRHRLELDLPEEPVWVEADAVRLIQIFSNLLHNAAKYTDSGGCIKVRLRAETGQAMVEIQDTGVGIEASFIPMVFDLFTQAPVSLARAQGGLGIGLTLVRSLVELHGGTVAVRSEGFNRGSTFTVRLPLSHEAEATKLAAPPAPAAERALRILIVDDNQDAADTLADIMGLMGHHAEVAYGAASALQRAPDIDPDLILLDIGLPEMDGYEVARRLRRTLRPDVLLAALTGYGASEDKARSREAGFDEHLVKPVLPEAITALLARASLLPRRAALKA